MLQIMRVLPLVFCLGSAKAVQCPRNGPKTGDKSQQIPRYAPVCPRGQPLGMAPDKCIKKATCLMTTTQYNSNNSLTAEFKELLSKKEIIWMNSLTYRSRLKKDLWSKFRLGGTIWNPRQKLQLIHDPLCIQNLRDLPHKSTQSVRFSRPNPSIRKPIHPPPFAAAGTE